jgi:hypothetical protein
MQGKKFTSSTSSRTRNTTRKSGKVRVEAKRLDRRKYGRLLAKVAPTVIATDEENERKADQGARSVLRCITGVVSVARLKQTGKSIRQPAQIICSENRSSD